MKSVLFVLVTVAALGANAWGLESFYGKISQHGHDYYCTYTNTEKVTLDMKYVAFDVDRLSGDNNTQTVQTRIDRKVAPGKTITASTTIVGSQIVSNCKFQAR